MDGGRRPGMALVNMSVVEQRYRAVLAVERGEPRIVVASQYGVSRQTLHTWLSRSSRDGLAGLSDRFHRPDFCPHQACGCPILCPCHATVPILVEEAADAVASLDL